MSEGIRKWHLIRGHRTENASRKAFRTDAAGEELAALFHSRASKGGVYMEMGEGIAADRMAESTSIDAPSLARTHNWQAQLSALIQSRTSLFPLRSPAETWFFSFSSVLFFFLSSREYIEYNFFF